jgi:hypothetical protein
MKGVQEQMRSEQLRSCLAPGTHTHTHTDTHTHTHTHAQHTHNACARMHAHTHPQIKKKGGKMRLEH